MHDRARSAARCACPTSGARMPKKNELSMTPLSREHGRRSATRSRPSGSSTATTPWPLPLNGWNSGDQANAARPRAIRIDRDHAGDRAPAAAGGLVRLAAEWRWVPAAPAADMFCDRADRGARRSARSTAVAVCRLRRLGFVRGLRLGLWLGGGGAAARGARRRRRGLLGAPHLPRRWRRRASRSRRARSRSSSERRSPRAAASSLRPKRLMWGVCAR